MVYTLILAWEMDAPVNTLDFFHYDLELILQSNSEFMGTLDGNSATSATSTHSWLALGHFSTFKPFSAPSTC